MYVDWPQITPITQIRKRFEIGLLLTDWLVDIEE
jgi:hypothetical protein